MTPERKKAEALEAMRIAASFGWTPQMCRDAGAQALIALGVDPQEADRTAFDIWPERFEIAGPC